MTTFVGICHNRRERRGTQNCPVGVPEAGPEKTANDLVSAGW